MPHPQALRDLALFVEVAKRRSFSQAARALGMPISSLSRRITLFESAVGLRLLDRTTRKIVLTSYGEAYLAQAMRLVEEAERTFDDLVAQAKDPSGFLKIAVPPDSWILRHLSPALARYSHEHAHVHLHVDLRPPPIDLAGDHYDLAILAEEPKESSLIARKIADVDNGLFAARSYLDACGRPATPQELAHHRVILPAQGTRAEWRLSRGRESVTVAVAGPLSCNSLGLARQFAMTGQGITAANVVQVGEDVAGRRLERVLPEWRLPPTPISIVTTSRLLPAKARSFIDFVATHLNAALAAAGRRPAANDGPGEERAPPARVNGP